ncbi:hypothetical protein NEF87_004403 [Candidatus Lokiarchaeum ossiferum]|uniref:ATP-dependent DNA helicase Hel308 n=1 Tax=Candidatus Lokiarchaeum ossiferum TaxID=2951803 RepID=A0ABY6HX66_9ARCH|nr:hypothetical protein NEF87_004403 [Candidatus Lokiarchaeum sp. B-35]
MSSNSPHLEDLVHPNILSYLFRKKIIELYPPQLEAIDAGITGRNLVVSIPTASGKTLIAEILALQKLLLDSNGDKGKASKKRGKVLYLCPLKALATEKYEEFKADWDSLGFRVGISTSDIDQIDYKVFNNDLIILTNEKADALLRLDPKRIAAISMVICDEIHLINDDHRGITLEFLLTRIKTANPSAQIVGLSATIQNAEELASWLQAQLITSEWRPVALKEGFYLRDEIHFQDGAVRTIPKIPGHSEVTTLAIDMIKEGGQVLVFTNSRKNTIKLADELHIPIRMITDNKEKEEFDQIQEEIAKIDSLETETAKKLHKYLKGGVAFHHAGLPRKILSFIVKQFNQRKIKVICCTPTLAAGVNTPARRVIIKTLYRYNAEKGNVLIPVIEYKQMAGRAGRPRFDPYGEVIILGSNPEKLVNDAVGYINGDPEKIFSKVGDENKLQSHILSLIVSKFADSMEQILKFLKNTFYYHQLQTGTLSDVEEALNNKNKRYTKRKSSLQKTRTQLRPTSGRGNDPLGLAADPGSFFTTASDYWEKENLLQSTKPKKTELSDNIEIKIERSLQTKIQQIINYFQENELITQIEAPHPIAVEVFEATPFGKICSQSYIPPQDGIIIKEDLLYAKVLEDYGEIELTNTSWLYLLSKLSAFRKFYLRKQDYNPIFTFIEHHSDNFIMEEVWEKTDPQFLEFAQELKLTMIMQDWISEVHEKNITERYNIGVGDIHNTIDNAQWLLRTMQQIARLDKELHFSSDLQKLNYRITHGIKESLIPLVKLKGIGRVRARKLFQAGFKTTNDILNSNIEDIAKVPLIGMTIARNIQNQLLNRPVKKKIDRKHPDKSEKLLLDKTTLEFQSQDANDKEEKHIPPKDINQDTKERKLKKNSLDRFF